MHIYIRIRLCIPLFLTRPLSSPLSLSLTLPTVWQRLIGCLKMQVIFCKRATNYMALLWKMTCKDKASYDSTPLSILRTGALMHSFCPCTRSLRCSLCLSPALSVSRARALSPALPHGPFVPCVRVRARAHTHTQKRT